MIPQARPLLYNPSQIPREDLKRLFIVRTPELNELLSRFRATQDSPQHHLVIGGRGTGKTTLLHRLAYAIEDDEGLSKIWIPICFDEEQYNVGDMADLWLNGLEAAAEKLESSDIYGDIQEIKKKFKGEKLKEEAFRFMKTLSLQRNRKLVLMIDNIDIVLDRLSAKEVKELREILTNQEEPWLILVGASSRPIAATFKYDSPLYELFRVTDLKPLSLSETRELLQGLAKIYGSLDRIRNFLEVDVGTVEVLAVLMGGNPRTVTTLFAIVQVQPDLNLEGVLTHLLDQHTSDYKDRIEALPTQGQRVFDALAQHWNPATAEHIAGLLRIDRGAASAQLHRLVDRGLVRKVRTPERPMGFSIAERFFNIWCLMRGGRRNRQRLRSLLEYLRLFYGRREERQQGFRRFVSVLKYLDLLDEELNHGFLSKIRELEGGDQPSLPGLQPREEILALCRLGRFEEADSLALGHLKVKPDSLFLRLSRAYALEALGQYQEALDVLRECVETEGSSDWLRIEYARLLLAKGQSNDASQALAPLMSNDELPPEQLTRAALDLAQVGGDSVAWLSQALLQKARAHDPERLDVLLASCRLELLLERTDRALEILHSLLDRYVEMRSDQVGFEILDVIIELARVGREGRLLELLEESELADSWLPLAAALEHLEDPERRVLERLAPELRRFTELTVARIRNEPESLRPPFEKGAGGDRS